MPEAAPINVADYERLAARAAGPGAYGYFAGGAGDERTLRDNVEAYGRWRLRPRALVDVSGAVRGDDGARHRGLDAAAGRAGRLPAHGPPATARRHGARGRRRRHDHVPVDAGDLDARRGGRGRPGRRRWFQLYCFRDRGVTQALIDQADEAGFDAIALTVDAPRLGRRERDLRTGFAIPAE